MLTSSTLNNRKILTAFARLLKGEIPSRLERWEAGLLPPA
jgi:hypothetical protein